MMKIFNNDLVVHDWNGLVEQIKEIYKDQMGNKGLLAVSVTTCNDTKHFVK